MSYKFRFNLRSVICVSAISASVIAYAATPVELQKARHEHYEELGDAFKGVRDQMKASAPDFAVLLKGVEVVSKASINQQQWFAPGTGPEAGKTRALAEVWSKPDEFTAAQKKFADATPKLLAAAKAKDIDGVKAAFREVGGSCKNCHDTFRSEEDAH